MPEISIIVPVYKVEKYLDRCVESILSQTFNNFELILVDDGSPDKCPEMCDDWAKKDKRIRVIHKSNGGLSSARNAGLDIIEGDYVCFVDSDDWVTSDMCEYFFYLAQKYSADIISTLPIRCSEAVEIKPFDERIELLNSKEFIKRVLKVNTRVTEHYAWGKLYRSELWNSIRFPEGLIAEDVLSTFEVTLKANKIIRSNQNKYFYYQNSEGITGSGFTIKEFDLLKIWDLVCLEAQKIDDSDIQYWARMNRYRADLGLLCKAATREIPADSFYCVDQKLNICKKELRNHYWSLLHYTLPGSRKIMLTAVCINYHIFCYCIKVGLFIKNYCNRIRENINRQS